jgi:hypothetical protein
LPDFHQAAPDMSTCLSFSTLLYITCLPLGPGHFILPFDVVLLMLCGGSIIIRRGYIYNYIHLLFSLSWWGVCVYARSPRVSCVTNDSLLLFFEFYFLFLLLFFSLWYGRPFCFFSNENRFKCSSSFVSPRNKPQSRVNKRNTKSLFNSLFY